MIKTSPLGLYLKATPAPVNRTPVFVPSTVTHYNCCCCCCFLVCCFKTLRKLYLIPKRQQGLNTTAAFTPHPQSIVVVPVVFLLSSIPEHSIQFYPRQLHQSQTSGTTGCYARNVKEHQITPQRGPSAENRD